MTYNRTGRAARGAFTLTEILVVILIIALLASLTAAGIMKIVNQGPQLKTSSEIRQFDVAIQQFMQEFNVNYIPSYLVIRENNTWNPNDPAEINSRNYLQRIFGKHVNLSPPAVYDWNGNGQIDARLVLEGEHCLTFFLGGIPADSTKGPPGVQGFSTNPQNPAALPVPGQTRRGPFFQNFEPARLKQQIKDSTQPGFFFYTYLDAWPARSITTPPQPYAYFSAYGVQNGYASPWGKLDNITPHASDCLTLGLLPYVSANGTYANPNTYQIISAGRDNTFGTGGLWNPVAGGNPAVPAGQDNQSNFAKGVIEAGQ